MAIFANAGIPMLFVIVPWLALGIFPVILIEAVWYWRTLRIRWADAFYGSAGVNFFSTVLGYPALGFFRLAQVSSRNLLSAWAECTIITKSHSNRSG